MKTTRIVWPVLLVITGMACGLAIINTSQPSRARIIIENDVVDRANGFAPAPSQMTYDTYFTSVNDFRQILILTDKSK